MDHKPIFADRRDAGTRLAKALQTLAEEDPVVLALPRGGVPVGFEVARVLQAPLDLVFVRKLGAPGHPELGVGALVDGADPQVIVNEAVMRQVQPPPGYLDEVARRELAEIERRRKAYLGDRPPLPVRGRTVVVVDDGVATGGTVRAALAGLARADARRIVLALPVGPQDIIAQLREDAYEVVCLETPRPFFAVGTWYENFDQTEDWEVITLLDEARRWSPAPPRAEPPRAEEEGRTRPSA